MSPRNRWFAFLGCASFTALLVVAWQVLPSETVDPITLSDRDAATDIAPTIGQNSGLPTTTLHPRESATVSPGRLTPQDRGSISGRVVNLNGDPIASARVIASGDFETKTDDTGRFRFAELPFGSHEIRAESPDYAALPDPPVRLFDTTPIDVIVRMEPANRLSGSVRDASGEPLEGVAVSAVLESVDRSPRFEVGGRHHRVAHARTDAAGQFQLVGLPAGTVQLAAEKPGFNGAGLICRTDGPPQQLDLVALPRVFGRVVSAHDGRPLAVSRISLLVQTRDGEGPWKVMDDPSGVSNVESPDGTFQLFPRTLRPLRVVAEGPDFLRTVSAAFELDGRSDHGPIVLTGPSGRSIQGAVRDDAGAPVSGAAVEVGQALSDGESLQLGRFRANPVFTDAEGRFVTAPVAPGPLVVSARVADGPLTTRELDGPAQGVELILSRTGTIQGHVASRGEGALPICSLVLSGPGHADQRAESIDLATGAFQISGVAPGEYRLQLLSGFGQRTESTVTVRAGAVQRVALELSNVGALQGVVRLNGKPAPFCLVNLGTGVAGELGQCATDANGLYALRGIPAGTYALTVRTSVDVAPHSSTPAEVRAGETVRQDIHVTTGAVRGVIIDAHSELPLAGVRVRLEQAREGRAIPVLLAELETDAQGVWAHNELPTGALWIVPTRRFHAGPHRVACEVIIGPSEAPQIAMQAAGQLEVILRSAAASVTDEFEVTLRPARGTDVIVSRRRTGAGPVKLGDLPPGIYDVRVENLATGKLYTKTASVRVEFSETVVVEL